MQKKTECTVNVKDGKVTITFDCNKNNDIAAIMAKALQMSGDNCNYKAVGKIDVPSDSVIPEQGMDVAAATMKENGDIFDIRHYHRFVTAQMLGMLTDDNLLLNREGFTKKLNNLGVMYAWRETADRIHAIRKAYENNDTEGFLEDGKFYNSYLIYDMLDELISSIERFKNCVKTKNHNGERYIPFKTRNFKSDDIDGVYLKDMHLIIERLEYYKEKVHNVRYVDDFAALDELIHIIVNVLPNFDKMNRKLKFKGNFKFSQPRSWQRAYKGFGAYFSMKNLIMGKYRLSYFLRDTKEWFKGKQAKIALCDRLEDFCYNEDQYKLFGEFMDFLDYNNFDIKSVLEEWTMKKKMKMQNKKK